MLFSTAAGAAVLTRLAGGEDTAAAVRLTAVGVDLVGVLFSVGGGVLLLQGGSASVCTPKKGKY